jgi:hypothetical protein
MPAPGDELPDFELPDQTVGLRSWDSFRGRAVLLINWSPYCGYCLHIAGTLGECKESLDRQGIGLVFVISGDPDASRSVFENAGLQGMVVLGKQQPDTKDPFAGLGTPAAWFVDADGGIAAPLAHSASDVLDLALRLGVTKPSDDAGIEVRYLPGAGGACEPGGTSSGAARKGVPWLGTAVYRLGEFHVGVRSNSEKTAATLDRFFPMTGSTTPRLPITIRSPFTGRRSTTESVTSTCFSVPIAGGPNPLDSPGMARSSGSLLHGDLPVRCRAPASGMAGRGS